MQPAKDPSSFLARHKRGKLDELRGVTDSISGVHHGENYDCVILLRS